MSELIPARAVALSLTSTNATSPELSRFRATSIRPRLEPPSGGSSCTDTTNSPALNACASRVSRSVSPSATAASPSLTSRRKRAGCAASIADLIAAISVGVVPQQPPMIPAPEIACLRCELGEVLGMCVRIDHPAAEQACEADVRERGKGRPKSDICSIAVSAASRPAPWLAPIAATASSARRLAASRAPTPASVCACSSKVRSVTIGSDETLRRAPTA